MAIPEQQLETWSHHATTAITQSKNTYASIKRVLKSYTYNDSQNIDIFLQGSYGNDTNVYGESDVDIVICFQNTYAKNLNRLSEKEKQQHINCYANAIYRYEDFKNDVVSILQEKFGNDLTIGNKALNLRATSNRRSADIIPTIQYRDYFRFVNIDDQSYASGLYFKDESGNPIINYPKQHSLNLTEKHQQTNNLLKPMIRIFKNMKNRMIQDGLIAKDLAPSYYIENLLHNVPNEYFVNSHQSTLYNILNWLHKSSPNSFICASQQGLLFNDPQLNSWDLNSYNQFLGMVIKLYNEWGS